MNIVAHLTECRPGSTIASARVARFIVNTLAEARFNLVDTKTRAEWALNTHEKIETLIIVNGPMAFCDFLEPLAELVRRAAKVVWVQQDYTIMPPSANSKAESPFRKVFADLSLRPVFWTTVLNNIKNPGDQYVNWNQLTYDLKPLPELHAQIDGKAIFLYYGAFRQNRDLMFSKYLHSDSYDVKISTTPIRGKKFKLLAPNAEIVPPFTDLGNLPKCSASIYIEDPKSSKEFHSPANRFYEMLSAGIPLFFERSTHAMLYQAGIDVPERWIVNNQEQLWVKLKTLDLDNMRLEQRVLWERDYVELLKERLLQVWAEHSKNMG